MHFILVVVGVAGGWCHSPRLKLTQWTIIMIIIIIISSGCVKAPLAVCTLHIMYAECFTYTVRWVFASDTVEFWLKMDFWHTHKVTGHYRELRFYPIISFIIKRKVVANPRMLWLYNMDRKRRPKDDPLVDRVDLNFRSDKKSLNSFWMDSTEKSWATNSGCWWKNGRVANNIVSHGWLDYQSPPVSLPIYLLPLDFVFRVVCYVYLD